MGKGFVPAYKWLPGCGAGPKETKTVGPLLLP